MSGDVLVVGPSWVGDMVMAQSLFIDLARRSPGTAIDVLAPSWSAPLLARMPQVRSAIDMPLGHGQLGLATRFRLGRSLAERNYRRAIVLPNSFKSALVPFWARIPRRTGYRGEQRFGLINDMRALRPQSLPMTVQRFVALAADAQPGSAPEPAPPRLSVDPQRLDCTLEQFGLARAGRPVLALCPGAEFGPAKRWPARHFAELARARIADGWSVWLFGSQADRKQADVIEQVLEGRCVNLAGRTSLGEAIDLLSVADVALSNDSGLMHVAAALDVPVVAVYGSSDPGFTPPLGGRTRIVSLDLGCSPCFKRDCPLGHTRCLEDLSPQRVQAAIDALLQDGSERRVSA